MIHTIIDGIRISAVSAAVSPNWESVPEVLARLGDDTPDLARKFTKMTGVKGRYNAGKYQTTSDFCYAAARKILTSKDIDPNEIGLLVFVTQTADYRLPATACLLQDRLKLSKDCIAFDVNLGCSGFTYGINIASSIMKTSNITKALLLCGDTSAKKKDSKTPASDSHSRLLFGDSGTATLLEKDNNTERIHMLSRTDGSGYKAIISPYGGWRNPSPPPPVSIMDDIAVFTFATREVPPLINETMKLSGYNPESYDCLVLHQANLLLMKQIAKKTGFPPEKLLVSLDEFGNTSSASVPVTLVKQYGNHEAGRLHAMCCGFGVGLSWSTVDCFIDAGDILPLEHTDEFFDDGFKTID